MHSRCSTQSTSASGRLSLLLDDKPKNLRNLHNLLLAIVEAINCKEHDDEDNLLFTDLELEEINEAYFTLVEELVAPALADVLREPNDDSEE